MVEKDKKIVNKNNNNLRNTMHVRKGLWRMSTMFFFLFFHFLGVNFFVKFDPK
jgi:hypothetical protein